ncbi:MAG: extracellular matrix/biofilm biosynthesis regulator RemA family protein [Candidatus Oleimicrobiaceae bacterium]
MRMVMVGIGHGNYVAADKVVAVVVANSKPIRQMIREAREQGRLVDATAGKRTRTVLVMSSNQVVLSANLARTILQRLVRPLPSLEQQGDE